MTMTTGPLNHWKDISWDKRFEIWAYPIAVIEDRYGGTYSGGQWIAIAGITNPALGAASLKFLAEKSEAIANPWGGDIEAGEFWSDPPKWIAAGDTPDAAIAALKAKNADMDWPDGD
jgi:hypothetical protein